ncbi:ABC transporter substrate-binding protein [Defluviimonas sp. WL0024]|uniref:ABC transporter substrate-binding protein n=2 Tax=Albidovulum TaxID=205889 RepID=A0ABT3J8Y8_9RHOB|nr:MULTISPECIES: ABC transporter substrate-binding protein [Defluviimonas]MCU9850519.1 ABC transporter substrate-binding protein [Defluviimonas sp. WL0024]MCW3784141.1 ABC transporter substrate-binding protein [Defluviimonas salinarum]
MKLVSACVAVVTLIFSSTFEAAAETKTILGVWYEGCEHLCEGLKDAIAESGFDAQVRSVDIAQDKSLLRGVVETARNDHVDLVVTFGTSVTLGIIGTLDEVGDPRFLDDIPVVFTVVADPFGTRIAESFERSGRENVAGTFNRVPEAVNIEIIRQYDPSFKKLGLLYHANERNSVIKKEELETLLPDLGIEFVALELDPGNPGVPDPALIPDRMAEFRELGVRWMYLGSSSFLRFNGDLYTSSAVENGIAIVSPYESLVRENRALLSIAARYYDVGKLAADQALAILRDGAVPGDLPILRASDFAYVVNMDVARDLNRIPPFAFLQIADIVSN